MSKLYLCLTFIGLLNVSVLVMAIFIINEFKKFEMISNIHQSIYELDQKLYKQVLAETKQLEDIYDDHKHLLSLMAEQYNGITAQYKTIGDLMEDYRKVCKECVDRYGDAYDQFKLCTEKLDKIFEPPVCGCNSAEVYTDEPIGGFHDD